MKSMPKWLLLPPAVAALLLLGSLSMQSGSSAAQQKQPTPPTTPAEAVQDPVEPAPVGKPIGRREAPQPPRTPDLWEMSSALIGVLLLGVGGVLVLRRLRAGPGAPRGANLLSLRQTLRLSTRQSIHAIEFDDRILLVGETDKSLSLLDSGKLPERAADEAEVAARAAVAMATALAAAGEDEGAVPKNLVIPRPASPLPRRLPTPPTTPANRAPAKTADAVDLADFRNLLQKVTRS